MIRFPTQALLPLAALIGAGCSGTSSAAQNATAPAPAPVVSRDLPENAPVDPSLKNIPATVGQANLAPSAPPFTITQTGKFTSPFAIAFLPDGRLLVTEKPGHLKLRATNGSVTEISGVPATAQVGQGGLLDVEVAPDFAATRRIYLSYSEPRPQGSSLALATATLGATALEDLQVIWRAGSDGPGGQFGANIAFAPDGQSLFLSSGERQRFSPAQDPDQALGKILHLTLDGKPAPGNPPGNFGASSGGVRAATWSTGHRNPYGLSFDSAGRLWEIEMGPRGGDELNLILPGRNYGWPIVSNGDNYSGQPIPDQPSRPDLEAPKLWWKPSISPGGLIIYSGSMFPAWKGSAFIAALSGEALIRVTLNGDTAAPADQWRMGMRIRDIAQAPDGAIWLLEDGKGANGRLFRITPKG
ncbi:MAG: PQQ-dependent sugar dehydrogenase [Sphingomonas sp.]